MHIFGVRPPVLHIGIHIYIELCIYICICIHLCVLFLCRRTSVVLESLNMLFFIIVFSSPKEYIENIRCAGAADLAMGSRLRS